jgi:hypothetical protein
MVAVDTRGRGVGRERVAHPEEWLSILTALGGAAVGLVFLWSSPGFEPATGFAWAVPGWIAFAYLFFQILLLLISATQIRALGVLDSIISILPFVAGLVLVVEWGLGRLPFSGFQLNALAILVATGVAEFFLTIWIRFVINRRTIAIDTA